MRPVALGLLVVALACGGPLVTGLAAAAQTGSPKASAEAGFESFFAAYNDLLHKERFDAILEMTRQQRVPSSNHFGRSIIAVMQASAMIGLGREAEALKLVAEARRLQPTSPEPDRIFFVSALVMDRMDVAAEPLDRLIARFPDVVRELEWDYVRVFLRNEPEGADRKNEDRRIALAQMGFGGDTIRGNYMAENGVTLLMKRGDAEGARDLLPYVRQIDSVENMLIQKRYAALWPDLEQLAGPNLRRIADASVASATKRYREEPGDTERLKDLAGALRDAGRYSEAIALLDKLPKTPAEMGRADEDMAWAVNYVALALHRLGREDEADRLFAALNDAPAPEGAKASRISMKINRLGLLVDDGRFDRAAQLLNFTEEAAKTGANDYGRQVVRRLKYCTMIGLGRTKEAEVVRAELIAHSDHAPGVTLEGLLCAGDLEAAEKLALATLPKKDWFPEYFVRELQSKPLESSDPSIWRARWRELRARPAIAREFERLGRDLPQSLALLPGG